MIHDIFRNKLHPSTEKLFVTWSDFLYERVDFGKEESKIHGRSHCERVLFHALRIGESIFGPDAAGHLRTLAVAAVFHDSRRRNDYIDTGHGARAASYYAEFCKANPSELAYDRIAALIMRFHDRNDRDGRAAIEREFQRPGEISEADLLYDIFKDADALDRFRLSDSALDTRYLRCAQSIALIAFAKEAVAATVPPSVLDAVKAKVAEIMASKTHRKLLFIVDPQIDFISGTLPVPGAENAMDSLGRYLSEHLYDYESVIISCDRHPFGHCSFSDFGGQWPQHCVTDTVGAAIWPAIAEVFKGSDIRPTIIHKGESLDIDEYSGFVNPVNREIITSTVRRHRIDMIDFCGLAGDICVFHTIRDAVGILHDVKLRLLADYTASVDTPDNLISFIDKNDIECIR